MKVRAIQIGFYGGLRIPETDTAEFEVPDGTEGSWFVPVEDDKKQSGAAIKPAGKKGEKGATKPAGKSGDQGQGDAGAGDDE